MRTLAFLAAAIAVATLVGCGSLPQYPNLTGEWRYTFQENGKDQVDTGTMSLKQDFFNLSGTANDGFGAFALTGKIEGTKFNISGQRSDGKRSCTMDVGLTTETAFSGTYSTDQKTAGAISGTRITATVVK